MVLEVKGRMTEKEQKRTWLENLKIKIGKIGDLVLRRKKPEVLSEKEQLWAKLTPRSK